MLVRSGKSISNMYRLLQLLTKVHQEGFATLFFLATVAILLNMIIALSHAIKWTSVTPFPANLISPIGAIVLVAAANYIIAASANLTVASVEFIELYSKNGGGKSSVYCRPQLWKKNRKRQDTITGQNYKEEKAACEKQKEIRARQDVVGEEETEGDGEDEKAGLEKAYRFNRSFS